MSNQFGAKIRQLREQNNLLLRQVAPFIDIDTPHLSKIERGERILRKEAVPTLAKILHIDENELMMLWLADQLYNIVQDEPTSVESLKLTLKRLKSDDK